MRPLLLALALASAAAAQPGAVEARLEGRFVRALSAMAVDDDSTALRLLSEVVMGAPNDAAVLTTRAELALRLGDTADAVFYAQRATEAADRAETFVVLAAALDAAGQDGARDAFAAAIARSPADPAVLTAAADWAAASGDAAFERTVLRDLVRVGDTVAARLRLSVLAERAGDADDALAQAEAADRLAPGTPTVRRRLDALRAPAPAPSAGPVASGLDALVAAARDNPRDLAGLVRALDALADASDPRGAALADDALLLYASVPAVLASAAEAYAAAGRGPDAQATARRGLDALDVVGDALPDAAALRARFDALLSP